MKAKEVLSILRITRPTLTKYVKNGTIKVQVLPNGRYDYDEKSVYDFLNKNVDRKTVLYCRVSTQKQKQDLKNQEDLLKQFCFSNGIKINNVYKDIASGIDFEKRKDFFIMLDEIIAGKIDTVVITYKDRLSRIGFNLFTYLFQKYNCKIIIVSEIGSTKLDSEEIFEEIVSLLHCYSMKLYSNRRVKKLKEIIYNDKLS
ncbi:IS607 family transposase [uncultured Intestinibacter sp.]|uniref:IS607 family transposase n=1 Tax=uncultured Intestinibacter sp. TaxID=1505659 RepID=UPI0027DD2984|nr:IS607 family transposase [uncultured Intestinibacter sp.]